MSKENEEVKQDDLDPKVKEEQNQGTDPIDDGQKDNKPELKYSDEDINTIVDKKFAKWQEKKESEINEAQELAKMNAQEKAEHERDKLEAELNQLRQAQTRSEMTSAARAMLKDNEIAIDDQLLTLLVDVDAEKTKNNVDSFKETFNDAVEKEVLKRIKNPHEKRGTTSRMTKKEIMDIADTKLRQEKIKQHMHLFKQ